MGTHQYKGIVVDRKTQAGLAGLRVETWDARRAVRDMVVATDSDGNGRFTLSVTDEQLDRLFGSRPAVLTFRILDGTSVIGADTSQTWRANSDAAGRIEVASDRIVGQVVRAAPYSVEGQVLNSVTGPLADVAVQVVRTFFSADGDVLETATTLAATTTDSQGRYRIQYDVPSGGAEPDIKVQSISPVGETRLPRAASRAVADIIIAGESFAGGSRFASLVTEISRIVLDLPVASVVGPIADHVAARSLSPRQHIDNVASAHSLSNTHTSVPAEAFFGLISSGLPSDTDTLFTHRLPEMRDALKAAAMRGDVSGQIATDVETHIGNLQTVALTVLKSANANGLAVGKAAGHITGIDSTHVDTFLTTLVNYEGKEADFWSNLPSSIASFRSALQVASETSTLSLGHEAMVQHILGTSAVVRARDLAKVDWDAAVTAATPLPSGVTHSDYVDYLKVKTESRFRTPYLAAQVSTWGSTWADVNTFFAAHVFPSDDTSPLFDFHETRIGRFLAENPAISLPSGAQEQLKSMERIYKLTDSADEAKTVLVTAGLTSASAIHSLGFSGFSDLIGSALSDAQKQKIFERACYQSNASTLMFNQWSPSIHPSPPPRVVPDSGKPKATPAPAIADWSTLFGSASACACEECQSVYVSPHRLDDGVVIRLGDGHRWLPTPHPLGWASGVDRWKRRDGHRHGHGCPGDGHSFGTVWLSLSMGLGDAEHGVPLDELLLASDGVPHGGLSEAIEIA